MNKISYVLKNYKLNKINFYFNSPNVKGKRVKVKQSITSNHSDLTGPNVSVSLNVSVACAVFKIEVEYNGYFSFNDAFENADIKTKEKIIHVNCIASLFPFVRELIAETTRRADVTPLILPSLNFVSAYEKLIESKNDEQKELNFNPNKTIDEIPV